MTATSFLKYFGAAAAVIALILQVTDVLIGPVYESGQLAGVYSIGAVSLVIYGAINIVDSK